VGCIVTGRGDPGTWLVAMFTLFTNPLIAFMTLRPVSFPTLRSAGLSRAKERSLSPLPAAPPGTAAKADDPLYQATRQHWGHTPGGIPEVVPPSDQASKAPPSVLATQQANGRHARQEAPDAQEAPAAPTRLAA
jgi:hypothetical protein